MSKKNSAIIISFSVLALLAFFVLIVFARSLLDDTVEETRLSYEQAFDELQEQTGVERFNTPDPFVTKAPEEPVASQQGPPLASTDPSRGPLDAVLTIIEYGDFECPFCAELASLLRELLSRHDNLRLVWKDLPNRLHLNARPAALAARCAQAQGKFWEYHDALFLNQVNLGPALYEQIAQSLALDVEAFNTCLKAGQFEILVSASLGDIETYNIPGTPFLFVGKTRVDQLISLEALEAIVTQELAGINNE